MARIRPDGGPIPPRIAAKLANGGEGPAKPPSAKAPDAKPPGVPPAAKESIQAKIADAKAAKAEDAKAAKAADAKAAKAEDAKAAKAGKDGKDGKAGNAPQQNQKPESPPMKPIGTRSLAQALKAADGNGDGRVTQEELGTFRTLLGDQRQDLNEVTEETLDLNGDGRVAISEAEQLGRQRRNQLRRNRNLDRVLDRIENRLAPPPLARAILNNVTDQMGNTIRTLADADGNGRISRDELDTARQDLQEARADLLTLDQDELDLNQDGTITLDEAQQAGRSRQNQLRRNRRLNNVLGRVQFTTPNQPGNIFRDGAIVINPNGEKPSELTQLASRDATPETIDNEDFFL